jgi:NAD(P)-dependent dehydrogenase (short-subunit alcohol dehydrogenase family)
MSSTNFRLDNKVIVITGAAGLLGKQHAEAILSNGGIPILLDLNQNELDFLALELNQKYGSKAVGFAVNITKEEEVKKNAEKLIDQFEKIDGLVNNAANNPKVEKSSSTNFSRLENFPIELWNQDISVGLTGAFICAKYYGNLISKNPNGGSIINISSDLGLIAPDQRLYMKKGIEDNLQAVKPVTYSVVKTGLIGLTRYLSTYWTNQNVRCNAICPGGVENGQPEDFLNELSNKIPMKRLAQVDEYQGAIVWMLSDASSYLNGAIVPVDGGRSAW